MKTFFIVKGSRKEIRVADKYVSLYHAEYLHSTTNDFGVIKFNTKSEEKAAFKGICEHEGEKDMDFYKDTETGVSYVRVNDMGNEKGWVYLSQFFNYTGHYDFREF